MSKAGPTIRAALAVAPFLLDDPGIMKHTLLATALSLGVVFTTGCGARSAGLDPEAAAGSGSENVGGAGSGSGITSAVGTGGAGPSGTTTASTTGVSVGPSSGSGSGSASGPGSSGSGGGKVCPGFGDECTGCLSGACPSTYCTCYENDECLALIECVNVCSSDACQQMCFSAHPDGISDLYLLTDCAATECDSECPGNTTVDPCTKCIFEDCSSEMNTCLGDPECLALYTCLSDCGNNDLICQKGCYAAHGGAVAELQAVLDCSATKCPGPCGQ